MKFLQRSELESVAKMISNTQSPESSKPAKSFVSSIPRVGARYLSRSYEMNLEGSDWSDLTSPCWNCEKAECLGFDDLQSEKEERFSGFPVGSRTKPYGLPAPRLHYYHAKYEYPKIFYENNFYKFISG